MYSLCALAILCACKFFLGFGAPHEDVTYEELESLDADCYPLDNCESAVTNDRLDRRNCHCGKLCVKMNTCCVDSRHRPKNRLLTASRFSCNRIYGYSEDAFFMISHCKTDWRGDRSVMELCESEVENHGDLLRLVPVISTDTTTTYKNYFCLQCNEDNDARFVFWNVNIENDNKPDLNSTFPILKFEESENSWTVIDKRGLSVPVLLSVKIPGKFSSSALPCRTDVISTCSSGWKDDAIKKKCAAYMGIVFYEKSAAVVKYRNVHCALCNFEDIKQKHCSRLTVVKTGKKPLSFALLLDVNRSDGDNVGEVKKCGEKAVYDPFFKKCRPLKCALPGFFLVDGKCTKM